MAFNLSWAYAQFLSRVLLNATCILNTFWIVSVNLMGIMWSENDIERMFVNLCVILHTVDL